MTSSRPSSASSPTSPSESPSPQPETPSSSPSPESPSTFLFQPAVAATSDDLSPQQEDPRSTSPDAPLEQSADAGSGSAPRSTLGRTPKQLRKDLLPAIRTAVSGIGAVLHQVLTVDGTLERDQLLYLPDEDDVDAIAEPVAGLASRRMPEGAGDPDVADLIALAIGVGSYVVKQLTLRAQLRALKKQAAGLVPVDHTPPEPQPEPGLGDAVAPETMPVGV